MEMLCAVVNNNVRCYNESMEFAERVEDTLDDDHKVRLPMRACSFWPCPPIQQHPGLDRHMFTLGKHRKLLPFL